MAGMSKIEVQIDELAIFAFWLTHGSGWMVYFAKSFEPFEGFGI